MQTLRRPRPVGADERREGGGGWRGGSWGRACGSRGISVAEARMSAGEPDEKAASLASQQHGLITREQALALGMSRSAIQRRVRAKRWIALRRGVYCFAGVPRTDRRDVMEACLGPADDGAGAPTSPPGCSGIWTRCGRAGTSTSSCRHQKRRRERRGMWSTARTGSGPRIARAVDGIPVTSPTRTIIDLAGILPEEKLALTVMDAARRELIEPDDVPRGRRRSSGASAAGTSSAGSSRAAPTASSTRAAARRGPSRR